MEKLFAAGPVSLDEEVLKALSKPVISHKSAKFAEIFEGVEEKLCEAYGAGEGVVDILMGSGTLAVDAMVYSSVNRGDRVLVVNHGEFGNKLRQSFERRGAEIKELRADDGNAVAEGEVLEEIDIGDYDALAMVYTETSTGLAYRSAEKIGRKAKEKGIRVLVDAASAMFGEDIKLDGGYFDAISTCSQKCLAAPPGMSFVGLSEEAYRFVHGVREKPRYLDLAIYADFISKGYDFPQTPAVNLVCALDKALDIMLDTGREKWIEKHRQLTGKLYAELPKLGYRILVANEAYRSNSVATFRVPEGLSSDQVIERVEKEGYVLSQGMGSLKSSVVRIGTMGTINRDDVDRLIDILQRIGESMGK